MKTIVFVQADGQARPTEMTLPEETTGEGLRAALKELGIALDDDVSVLLDDADEPVDLTENHPLRGIKRGARVHVTRCLKARVTVHFLEKTAHETFPVGARVRKVKAWAVREFKLEGQDAAEHVLQVCGSTTRPATDTPLHELIQPKTCSVCFDLVPEKRVEG